MNFPILLSIILSILHFSDAYDSMDPKGEITIRWDFQEFRYDGYTVTVSIYNDQLYRHIELPGWKYGWTWGGEEVIVHMTGAEATEQGNCTRFKGVDIPHSCERSPVIVDLLPGVLPYNKQIQNCCRGGVLSSKTQERSKSASSFQMSVGSNLDVNDSSTPKPYNFSLGVPGYTCSNVSVVSPTRFLGTNTRHWTQAMLSWRVTCSFSQFRASLMPTCCVSLSTFYNDTIVSCPTCSCACQKNSQCPRGQVYNTLQAFDDEYDRENQYITCTEHMCPIRVHWHLKASYKQYWRVKLTISNFNMAKNYTDWNLVIQHPNMRSLTQVYSFNYKPIIQYGNINDTAMFWGLKYYNDMLLQAGNLGNVQSELLLQKDPGIFTFQGGWAFPRSLLFNGHECVMPSPDDYPSLPRSRSSSTMPKLQPSMVFALFASTLVLMFL